MTKMVEIHHFCYVTLCGLVEKKQLFGKPAAFFVRIVTVRPYIFWQKCLQNEVYNHHNASAVSHVKCFKHRVSRAML